MNAISTAEHLKGPKPPSTRDMSYPRAFLVEHSSAPRAVVAPRAAEADRTGQYQEDWFRTFGDTGLLRLGAPWGAGDCASSVAVMAIDDGTQPWRKQA